MGCAVGPVVDRSPQLLPCYEQPYLALCGTGEFRQPQMAQQLLVLLPGIKCPTVALPCAGCTCPRKGLGPVRRVSSRCLNLDLP